MALNAEVLTSYKKIDEAYIDELLKKEIEKNNKKIVVLDDDPTGVQTVHDISVYTNWEKDTIRQGFDEENNLFYVLTNSRGFTAEQTTKAHNEIAAVVDEVAKETGKEYIFISRSDSTLRGHYPLETELLKKNYEANTGKTIDGEILCPFFKEGGRYTIDNVHYVKYGEELIPANETEFAKDKTFGYSAATMPEYVEEKTKGAYKASDVTCISLEDIHDMNIDKIEEALMAVKDFNKIIVNAVEAHHGDVEPESLIACLVQAADAISAARPGARRETLETYTTRLKKLEDIANSYKGVEKTYAIQAGREIRVIVVPEHVNDSDMVLLARDIAKQIENELEYPGQIKVNIIRESRVVDYAK